MGQTIQFCSGRTRRPGQDLAPRGVRGYRCLVTAMAAVLTLLCIAAASASAASYAGTVLYPCTVPSGFSSGGPSNFAQTAASGQVVGSGAVSGTVFGHAILWSGPAGSPIDLNPTNLSGITESIAYGTNGTQQVGNGWDSSYNERALLWSSTADSAVDLSPTNLSGFIDTYAMGTNGTQQVGSGLGNFSGTSTGHALLWSGTAASAVDLHPTNLTWFFQSTAVAISGTQQVGNGSNGLCSPGSSTVTHALLWSGTANSAVDLQPTNLTGFFDSYAYGVGGGQQVGSGDLDPQGGVAHALLWSGTADSAVDLNPTNLTGFTESGANGTNGSQQVGYGGGMGGPWHALLWSGTADSAVDLHLLLPAAGTWTDSYAYSIDAAGNVYGTADGTFNDVTGTFAVEWSAVPEPTAVSMLVIGGVGLLARRRRNDV